MATAPSAHSLFHRFRRRGEDDRRDGGRLAALDRSLAVIEFAPDGTVLDANANFLTLFGCGLDAVRGRHHRMFVGSDAGTEAYQEFWRTLGRGEFLSGQFRRFAPDGREIWLQATYNPVLDGMGRVIRVVKFASDVTAQKRRDLDTAGQLAAIDRAMAVIEFALDGTILTANANFLKAMGYEADEVVGRHHSMFVDAAERGGDAYRAFWRDLAEGAFRAGQFRRIARDGRDVWIEASYNPILDADGRPWKVVKYASDVTAQRDRTADFESQIDAIHKVQAVIEFGLDGTILAANDHFLRAVGYAREDVVGRHHSMFVDDAERVSAGYAAFWERLARGEPDSGQYARRGRDGRALWLQASYNPILDASGRPYKVVKYATDVTDQVRLSQALTALVDRIGVFARSISTSAREIAAGNADLSERTGQQAAALEETAATMEEMSAAIAQTATNAGTAGQLSGDVAVTAREGQAAVRRVSEAMERIRRSSTRVVDVLSVIETVAFQTNILALNAAVEAARAGDKGRGFAVVASEVRALAQRCSASARDIKGLLGDSSEAVADGHARMQGAAQAMAAIVAAVDRTGQVVSKIGVATREQSQGVGQVNGALQSLEEGTQQNAALVEQVAAASAALDSIAAELQSTMARFALENGTATAAA